MSGPTLSAATSVLFSPIRRPILVELMKTGSYKQNDTVTSSVLIFTPSFIKSNLIFSKTY